MKGAAHLSSQSHLNVDPMASFHFKTEQSGDFQCNLFILGRAEIQPKPTKLKTLQLPTKETKQQKSPQSFFEVEGRNPKGKRALMRKEREIEKLIFLRSSSYLLKEDWRIESFSFDEKKAR